MFALGVLATWTCLFAVRIGKAGSAVLMMCIRVIITTV